MIKVWKMVIVAISVSLFAFAGMGHGEGASAHHGKKMPKNYRMVPMDQAELLQSGNAKMFCPKCGMTLPMFYRTNHAATVDGKVEQFCSMHCLVEEMNSGKKVSDIKVVDNSTLKFIPAQKAWYVVGSSKPATMSKVSKYAFGSKEAAEKFASENGGKVMNFADTLALAKKAYEKEAAMIAKKQAMMAQKGKAIYEKMCQKIDGKFQSAAEAKAYIATHNSCPGVKGKMLQAVGLYLKSR
jgi:nitrous oxide reductase accessory protein NosL